MRTTIFDGAASLETPEGFVPTGEDFDNASDQAQTLFTVPKDSNTRIEGMALDTTWDDDKTADRLNGFSEVLRRSVPAFQVAQMATRKTTNGLHGIIQYSYATPDKDWMGILVIFPAQEHIGMLFMTCTMDHAFERSQQFMDIAESLAPDADDNVSDSKPTDSESVSESSESSKPSEQSEPEKHPNWSQWQR